MGCSVQIFKGYYFHAIGGRGLDYELRKFEGPANESD